MHELALTRSLVAIAADAAQAHGAQRVRSVTVEIGTLAGVMSDAVAFCFEACCRGTVLEGSELRIVTLPGRGRCQACGRDCHLELYTVSCPTCGEVALERLQGEELHVIELEID